MDIYKTINIKLQTISKESLIKKMGYGSVKKGLDSLKLFEDSKDLYSWISAGHYDLKYSSSQFFEKLCEVLEIEKNDVKFALVQQAKYKNEIDKFNSCYIFVNTNFKRTTQPIFILAFAEGARRIGLDTKEFVFKTQEEILDSISNIVASHFKRKDGKVEVWGDIKNYIYHNFDGETYTFDVDGKQIENIEVSQSRATLSLK
ncbi:MAG: hypothetical protein U9P72_07650 [Campylobacterota bacterium]|nr:hypothetical protein [Campylobacterota bacterium]